MRYSIEPRKIIYGKGYGLMSFARNFSDKYCKSLIDKGIGLSKTFDKTAGKRILKESAKATDYLIGNKIADKITSKPIKNDVINERYVSPEERQEIFNKLSWHNIIMEYQKIANLLDDYKSNQPSEFRTKTWVEINDESRGTYNVNSQIKFKTTMLKSSLSDYSDAYILVKGTITITGAGGDAAARQADERDKGVVFKNCAPFTNCISEINNTQVDNTKDIDIVMRMYNLIEYSDNYSKTSGSLWQYYRDEPNDNLANSESFKFKVKITGKTPAADCEKDVEIIVPLKYLSNFSRTLEMPLINSEVNLNLTWSSTCVITNSTGFVNDTKLYVPVVTLSTKENVTSTIKIRF